MILDAFPSLQSLSPEAKTLLAAELVEDAMKGNQDVSFPPGLIAAIEERLAYNETHPDEVFTTAQVTARLAELKRVIAARRSRG